MDKPNVLVDLITGANDRGSSKKMIAISCLVVVLFMALWHLIHDGIYDVDTLKWLIGLIVAASGIGVVDKKVNDATPTPPINTIKSDIHIEKTEMPDSQ